MAYKLKLKAKDSTSSLNSILTVRAVSPYISNNVIFNIKREESTKTPAAYWSNSTGTYNYGISLDRGEIIVDTVNANTQKIVNYFVIENAGSDPEYSFYIRNFTGSYEFETLIKEDNKVVVKLTINVGSADFRGRNYEFIVTTPAENLTLTAYLTDHFMDAYVDCWITLIADNDENPTSTRFTAEMTVKIIGITVEPQEKTVTVVEYAGIYMSPSLLIGIAPFNFKYMGEEYSAGTLPCESFDGQMWGSGMAMNPHFEFINNTLPGHNPSYELVGGYWDAAGIYNINVSDRTMARSVDSEENNNTESVE